METILTVLSTIGVGALAYAFAGVIRLSRRVNDLELIRMEMIDLEDRLQSHLNDQIRDSEKIADDVYRRFDEVASSLDRRFDKVWSDIHKLDQVVNPNKDLVK
tara:strand:- start:2359 stop:2667 length:309 start_codon:yes stop_codon:yes gene_type:complete